MAAWDVSMIGSVITIKDINTITQVLKCKEHHPVRIPKDLCNWNTN